MSFTLQHGIRPQRGQGKHDANGSVFRWCDAVAHMNPGVCAADTVEADRNSNEGREGFKSFSGILPALPTATHACSIQDGEVKMPPLLFYYLPLIVLAGLTEVMLTTDELEEGDAAQHTPDSTDLMNASIIRFPTATRG